MKQTTVYPDGRVEERELTEEEIEALESARLLAEAESVVIFQEQEAKRLARESAISKLAALGLDAVEIDTILGA